MVELNQPATLGRFTGARNERAGGSIPLYVSTIDLRFRPCTKCGEWFEPTVWQAKKHWWHCPDCKKRKDAMTARARYQKRRDYFQRPDVKERRRAGDRLYGIRRWRDPIAKQKKQTRHLTQRALAAGRLTKLPCSICGNLDSKAHHRNYAEPLNVIWLCVACHKAEHQKYPPRRLPVRGSCDS